MKNGYKALGYGLSSDKLGLIEFFMHNGKISFYHIHSDEMSKNQKKIFNVLNKF